MGETRGEPARLQPMRFRMTHIASALAAAVVLVIVFMAAGILVVSALTAAIAAGLFAWIAYRVARSALSRTAQERRSPATARSVVPPPAG